MFLFFLLLSILPTAAWYLTSSATITKWLWSRYPAWLDELLHCAACSGFWWGNLVSLGFTWANQHPYPWYTAPIWGLVVLVTNPMVAALHTRALTPATSGNTEAINKLETAVDRLAAGVEEQLKRDEAFDLKQADTRLELQGVINHPVF
jgi:hypothetical protein